MYHVSAQGVDERMINVHYYIINTRSMLQQVTLRAHRVFPNGEPRHAILLKGHTTALDSTALQTSPSSRTALTQTSLAWERSRVNLGKLYHRVIHNSTDMKRVTLRLKRIGKKCS